MATAYPRSAVHDTYGWLYEEFTHVRAKPSSIPFPNPLGFGPSPKFGFKNPFQFFNLLQPARYYPTTNFGIGSVSVTAPLPPEKTRYLSSSYCPAFQHTFLLIIGGCVARIVVGEIFIM